jgi:hypothetical protein
MSELIRSPIYTPAMMSPLLSSVPHGTHKRRAPSSAFRAPPCLLCFCWRICGIEWRLKFATLRRARRRLSLSLPIFPPPKILFLKCPGIADFACCTVIFSIITHVALYAKQVQEDIYIVWPFPQRRFFLILLIDCIVSAPLNLSVPGSLERAMR